MSRSWMHRTDASGDTPLNRALKCGFEGLAEFVLREMHQSDHKCAPRPRPADSFGDRSETGETGTRAPGNIDTKLHKAIRDGYRDMVEAMLVFGADANETSASGMTPLHWCALTGDAELADVLVEHGARADAQAPGLGGLTPQAAAILMGYEEVADLLSTCGGTC
ncbi:MAG: ankyrin repeat domain-containing protein [Candidatus Hydrogenedentales bacterium]|jgi:hypothetical protein